ncbi:hypothetical protein [Streptomyces sp. NPDC057293]|uniref:hypothetical protein n=1 Tax=unclassified Streptomyces TaxID=2593676 RepID=UPI00362E6D51
MEGPEDVAYAAARLGAATEELASLIFRLLSAGAELPQAEHTAALAEIEAAMTAARQQRRNYRLLVMSAIRADGKEPEEDLVRLRAATLLDRPQGEASAPDGPS